ncbi:TD and POZ domain-containing protein 3 [Argiope bruennichi]|uniref:TD and POZ domain-containing protein 3 n=1 Tax=Argiope bruennichi TaxID=94029 RepID=A0A8T0EQF5_ARGBR|nr:TD and POZ domain-containing protein 3 [Argiope bruennichi]
MITEPELFSNVWYLVLFVSLLYLSAVLFRKPKSSSVKKQEKIKESDKDIVTRNDSIAYTLQWKVGNLNYCWLKEKKSIKSPTFTAEKLNDTKWSLELCGKKKNDDDFVSVSLNREKDRFGPEFIEVKYQLALLKQDGSILKNRDIGEDDFKRNRAGIWHMDEKLEKVFDTEKKDFLSEDTLTIQCKIWKKDEKPIMSELLSARTIFKVHLKSFVWKIEKFDFLRPDDFLVINELKDGLINLDLAINDEVLSEKSLFIDTQSLSECVNFVSFKASIINSEGDKVNFRNHEYIDDDLEEGISFPLQFKESMLTEYRSLYFPDNVLSLDCEYILSTTTALFECASCGNPSSSALSVDVKGDAGEEEPNLVSDLAKDLKSIHSNAILCDVELRTSSQTFPAHKAILSARSTVFRRMFDNDMKGKRTSHVKIPELDDATVHRMLTYIYTDSLGYLQMDTASKLYMAADKYDIPPLKRRCSSFLKDNLRPVTVCSVLVLADMHQDKELKSAVQCYIMEHDKEIFDTLEWKHFMATNLKLAADVMHLKVSQVRSGHEMR